MITFDGYLTDFVLTPANFNDRTAVCELTGQSSFLTIIADKGYIGDRLASDLKSEKRISLISFERGKSKNSLLKGFRQMIFKARRRIETSFS